MTKKNKNKIELMKLDIKILKRDIEILLEEVKEIKDKIVHINMAILTTREHESSIKMLHRHASVLYRFLDIKFIPKEINDDGWVKHIEEPKDQGGIE